MTKNYIKWAELRGLDPNNMNTKEAYDFNMFCKEHNLKPCDPNVLHEYLETKKR